MADMSSSVAILPPPHSRRVESWIYTVINPLIESLRREVFLLEKRNLTWRLHSRKCEYLRRAADYIGYAHLPNYEDFLADSQNPGFAARFESHDQAVAHVEDSAGRFFDTIINEPRFLALIRKSLKEYEAAATVSDPSLDSMQPQMPKDIAEMLVNRTGDLPAHYVMHKFWQETKERFYAMVSEGDPLSPTREQIWFRAIDKASSDLMASSDDVLKKLLDHRSHLCRTFDIPFAPLHLNKSNKPDEFIP
jgi:hypothetical protein